MISSSPASCGLRRGKHTLVELITRADLTPECREELNSAVKGIIGDWEGPPAQQ